MKSLSWWAYSFSFTSRIGVNHNHCSGCFCGGLVDVNHAVHEGPEEQVGLNAGPESAGEDVFFGVEVAVEARAQVGDDQNGENEREDKVEGESVEAGETEYAGCATRQSRHGRLTVVEEEIVVANGRIVLNLQLS